MLSLSTEIRLKITQQDPVVPELAQALPARSGWAERLRSPLAALGVGAANVTFEMQERKR